jgi:hypothetical protein
MEPSVDATPAMLSAAAPAGAPAVSPETRQAIARYIRLDDDLKTCTRESRGRRIELRELHNGIVQYMVANSLERLSVRRGECRLDLKRRERRLRPTHQTMVDCLRTALADKDASAADPERVVELLRNSGGTATEWRLARRNATTASKPKKKKVEGAPDASRQSPSKSST